MAQDGAMERSSYVTSVRADAERLLAAAGPGALDRPVPTCPGWTVERLVGHLGRVHRWTAGWVATGAGPEMERPPAGPDVVPWTRAGTDELVAALAGEGGDGTVATWAGPQPASFWPRRMAIETAIHRWDAENAVGAAGPIAVDLAVDGVDVLLSVILPFRGTGDLGPAGATIHLHATDPDVSGGEWLVTVADGGGVKVEPVHAKGDVAVRGPASDLLLLLYNRVGTDGCQVFGDEGLLARWRTAVAV